MIHGTLAILDVSSLLYFIGENGQCSFAFFGSAP